MKEKAVVEMVELGTSEIEQSGRSFTDSKTKGVTTRRLTFKQGDKAQTVSIKSETETGAGPVWVDDVPFVEINYDGDGYWTAGWFSRSQARNLAKALGATLEDA